MFFDEKTAGIEIIQHGVRLATGGAVRLSPTPEQWDQIPKVVDRKVDKAANTITCALRYEAFDFDSRLVVTPEGAGFRVAVYRRQAGPREARGPGRAQPRVPAVEVLRADVPRGRQARHLPALSHGADRRSSPATRRSASSRATRRSTIAAGTSTWRPTRWPTGKTLVLAPEDPERRVTIQALSGELQLLDGRNLAQNGWFIVRSLLPAKATGKVAEWVVRPNVIPNWTRTPVIGFSQVGYHPAQKKVAVIELDAERHGPRDGVALRGDGRRRAGRAAEGEGPALGPVPPVQVRHGGLQRRQPPRPVLHPVRQAEDGDVPDRPGRLRHHLARRPRTSGSRSRWTT